MTLLEILFRHGVLINSECNVTVTRLMGAGKERFVVMKIAESPTSKQLYAFGFLEGKPYFSKTDTTEFSNYSYGG